MLKTFASALLFSTALAVVMIAGAAQAKECKAYVWSVLNTLDMQGDGARISVLTVSDLKPLSCGDRSMWKIFEPAKAEGQFYLTIRHKVNREPSWWLTINTDFPKDLMSCKQEIE
jgi:hypothetical protein